MFRNSLFVLIFLICAVLVGPALTIEYCAFVFIMSALTIPSVQEGLRDFFSYRFLMIRRHVRLFFARRFFHQGSLVKLPNEEVGYIFNIRQNGDAVILCGDYQLLIHLSVLRPASESEYERYMLKTAHMDELEYILGVG